MKPNTSQTQPSQPATQAQPAKPTNEIRFDDGANLAEVVVSLRRILEVADADSPILYEARRALNAARSLSIAACI